MGKSALAAIETVFSPETYEVLWEIGKAVAKSMVLGDDEDLNAIKLAIGVSIIETIFHELQKLNYGDAYQRAEQAGEYIGGAILTYLSTKGAVQVLKDIKYYKGLSKGAGKTAFPENPADFNPSGLLKKEYNNGKIIKWQDPKTGKAIYEWNADAKYGDHYHYTPDGKNRAIHPDTGDTHIKPGDSVPK